MKLQNPPVTAEIPAKTLEYFSFSSTMISWKRKKWMIIVILEKWTAPAS